jgi:hypothetical protein
VIARHAHDRIVQATMLAKIAPAVKPTNSRTRTPYGRLERIATIRRMTLSNLTSSIDATPPTRKSLVGPTIFVLNRYQAPAA